MKLTMLGTGHATVTKCYNTCFALTEGGQHFLVDAGGGNGILGRLKAADISITDIHDIFVTHEHVDHLLGVVWMIRMIGTAVEQGKYNGELRAPRSRQRIINSAAWYLWNTAFSKQ